MSWWVVLIVAALAAYLIWLLVHRAERAVIGRSGGTVSAQTAQFLPANGPADVDSWLASSEQRPVWVFLHDPFCPISRAAWGEVERSGREVELVDVSRQRPMSKVIERRTGVRHESPQLLLLRHGHAVWSASHYEVTAASIAEAALVGVPSSASQVG